MMMVVVVVVVGSDDGVHSIGRVMVMCQCSRDARVSVSGL